MQFVDRVRVMVRAGDGGAGAVAWRREAHVARGGPAGGDGGRGGDVVLVADPGLSTLLDLRYRQHLRAEHGRPGASKDRNGRAGRDLVVRVPVGTLVMVEGVVHDEGEVPPWVRGQDGDEGPEQVWVGGPEPGAALDPFARADERAAPVPAAGEVLGDLVEPGQRLVVARGGRGGRGNIHFRSSTNRAPDRAEPGTPGQALWLRLELKLLADVGIVGFPNVGKSTLIARISRARPKVADYPFTTLTPNLGVVTLDAERTMVVADVPGLVPGASEGRGLGLDFMRHLERTRVLLHLLAPDPSPGREPMADLDVIEGELRRHGAFDGKPRVVALNKLDTLEDEPGRALVRTLRERLRRRGIPLFEVSAHTGQGVGPLLEALWRRVIRVPAPGPASDGPAAR